MAKKFYIDGTAGSMSITNPAVPAAITNPEANLASVNFHSSLPYLKFQGFTYNNISNVIWVEVIPEVVTWPNGGCDCFTEDSLVTMSDGTTKNIVDIAPGEKVLSINGTINTVTFIEKVPAKTWEYLYSPNNKYKPFATLNHPIYINKQLHAVDPSAIHELYPWLGEVSPLDNYNLAPTNTEKFVYNLWVSGDSTYIVNSFGTHCIMHHGHFLTDAYERGRATQDEILLILKGFTDGGIYIQYGAYLINKFLWQLNIDILNKYLIYKLKHPNNLVKSSVLWLCGIIGKLFHKVKKK